MTNCETCKKGAEPVPYIVHESAMARDERTIRRLWVLLLVMLVMLVGTNGLWIYYESQFEDRVEASYDIEQDTDGGGNNYSVIGGDFNGKAEGQDQDNENQDT